MTDVQTDALVKRVEELSNRGTAFVEWLDVFKLMAARIARLESELEEIREAR